MSDAKLKALELQREDSRALGIVTSLLEPITAEMHERLKVLGMVKMKNYKDLRPPAIKIIL